MKQRILVVEDETAIASVLDALLTEAGYEVTLATDGVQGLQAFHRQSFSLILLDLMLPGMDGFSVCRRLREEKKFDTPQQLKDEIEKNIAQTREYFRETGEE